MSSMPLISHRLFVAAVGSKTRPERKPAPQVLPPVALHGKATEVALEILDGLKSAPGDAARSVQRSLSLSGSRAG